MYSLDNINDITTELTLLLELTRVLNTNASIKNTYNAINEIFKRIFQINTVNIWLYEENSDNLKDFSDFGNNFCLLKSTNKNVLSFYKTILSGKANIIMNYKPFFITGLTENEISELNKEVIKEKNEIILPISFNSKIIGILEIADNNTQWTSYPKSFWQTLYLVASQISDYITKIKMREEMQLNVKFHAVMKDIAKIIESQYELSYIIPMIGEMVDKFMPEHLIYLLSKDKDGDYSLLWPTSCNFEKITPLLNIVEETKEFIISEDKSIGVFPLFVEGHIIGALMADGKSYKLNNREISYLDEISRQVATTMDKASCYAEILEHATIDALTGLYNRRQFEHRFEQEVNLANRKNTPLCCMMLDLDFFKSINDTYGHLVGDRAIQSLSKVIREEIRTYDIAGRFGGEEFCIILPDTSIEQAKLIAERIRVKVENTKFKLSSEFETINKSLITVSIGISEYQAGETDFKSLLDNADKALYTAKKSGRNRIIVSNTDK